MRNRFSNQITFQWQTKKTWDLADLLRYPGIGVCIEGLYEMGKLVGPLPEKDFDVSTAIPSHTAICVPAIES